MNRRKKWGFLGKGLYISQPESKPKAEPLNKNQFASWDSKKSNYERIDLIPRGGVVGGGGPYSTSGVTPTPTPTPSITPSNTPIIVDCYWNLTDEDWNTNTNNWNVCQDVVTPTPTQTSTNTPTPSVTPSPSPAPFDSDAAAFLADVLATGGTLNATISGATNTLFTDLKSAGLYTKMYAFYPMVGSTSTSTALNGKRTASTFDLIYNGGFTYTSSGATGNGLTGWANTNFNNSSLLQNDYSVGFYQFTDNTPVKSEELIMGQSFGTNRPQIQIATNLTAIAGGSYYIRSGDTPNANTPNGGNIDGFYILNRTGSTTSELFRNGNLTPKLTVSTTYTNSGGKPIALWNFYENTAPYSNGFANQGLCFAFIGNGLSDSDITNFSNIINTFQTTLGRNTY